MVGFGQVFAIYRAEMLLEATLFRPSKESKNSLGKKRLKRPLGTLVE